MRIELKPSTFTSWAKACINTEISVFGFFPSYHGGGGGDNPYESQYMCKQVHPFNQKCFLCVSQDNDLILIWNT